ncbi:hypothetical protein NDM58_000040 [Vibrio parahaemolyticus]|nr:hypothetical protein [Vibrio parahaemolyticus]
MRSYSVNKLNIAVEFIDDAIRLYDDKRYFSALHLAGAAEEIFSAYAVESDLVPTKTRDAKASKKLGKALYKTDISLKNLEIVADISKNAIKHATRNKCFDSEAQLRPSLDAYRMIRRALKNADLIAAPVSPLIYGFMSRSPP